jgi:ABC exporter DevB family membrane fusion protein
MKTMILTALAVASGAWLTFLVWRSPAAPPVPNTAPASLPLGGGVMEGIGYVEPRSEVRRLMFRTGGVIRSCLVKAGDEVRKGQVLVELEDSTQRAEVELACKQLDQARADASAVNAGVNPYRIKVLENSLDRLREKVRHARADLDRADQLVDEGGVSKQDHDLMATRRTQAEMELREQEAELLHLRRFVTPEKKPVLAAKVEQAAAHLRLAEQRLGETRLTAPCDGTVLKLVKHEGEGVSLLVPETVLLFGDLSRLRVRAEFDERFVKELRAGQAVEVYGRNLLGNTCPGRLVEVERVMGDKTVFTRASSEWKDLHVLQVIVEMDPGFAAPVGLQVDVRVPQDEVPGAHRAERGG